MKTLLQICQEISNTPNSGLDSPIASMSGVDDEQLNALNQALITIWNESDYVNLKCKTSTFNTVVGTANYNMVNGYIKENGVKIADRTLPLDYITDYENITQSAGTPTGYWIEDNDIVFNYIPDSIKAVTVKYRHEYPVITAGNIEQDYFVNATDLLNIPARLEKYFINCLAHYTNWLLNGDPTDEVYLQHQALYKKALINLKNADKGTLDNVAIISF